jgi:hypothetical protein
MLMRVSLVSGDVVTNVTKCIVTSEDCIEVEGNHRAVTRKKIENAGEQGECSLLTDNLLVWTQREACSYDGFVNHETIIYLTTLSYPGKTRQYDRTE